MATLYLRNVPDEVIDRLRRLAAHNGTSMGVAAVRELAESTRRVDNAALLASLPDLDVPTGEVVAALTADRPER